MPKSDTQFKKGKSGNPKGRAKDPPEVAEARKLTSQEFTKLATKYLFMTDSAIVHALDKKNNLEQIERTIGNMVRMTAITCDVKLANFIFDRVIGKVPTTLDANLVVESLHTQIVKALEKAEVA